MLRKTSSAWAAAPLVLLLSGCGGGQSCFDECEAAVDRCKQNATTVQEQSDCTFDGVRCMNNCGYGKGLPVTAASVGPEDGRTRMPNASESSIWQPPARSVRAVVLEGEVHPDEAPR